MFQAALPLYVIGAGGHAKVVIDALAIINEPVTGIIDDNPAMLGKIIADLTVVAGTNQLQQMPARGILAVGDNRVRERLQKKLTHIHWITVIHPRAYVAPSASIGQGSIVMAGAVVQPYAQLGRHVIINTCASVDHDCQLADYVHVAPGCHLAGNVTLEQGVFMGIGSCVLPGKQVGAWSTVGAGATVIQDLPAGCLAIGTPARVR